MSNEIFFTDMIQTVLEVDGFSLAEAQREAQDLLNNPFHAN